MDQRPLTPRQLEAVRLLVQGQSTKQMAEVMGISMTNVKFHITTAARRLGLRPATRVTLAVWAAQHPEALDGR